MIERIADIEVLLLELKIEDTPTNREHLNVLLQAFAIFAERNARYKDVWKHSGWRGSLFDLRKKVVRMWQTFWRYDGRIDSSECDDAYDVINYAVFFIRNAEANNADGTGFTS